MTIAAQFHRQGLKHTKSKIYLDKDCCIIIALLDAALKILSFLIILMIILMKIFSVMPEILRHCLSAES